VSGVEVEGSVSVWGCLRKTELKSMIRRENSMVQTIFSSSGFGWGRSAWILSSFLVMMNPLFLSWIFSELKVILMVMHSFFFSLE